MSYSLIFIPFSLIWTRFKGEKNNFSLLNIPDNQFLPVILQKLKNSNDTCNRFDHFPIQYSVLSI